MKAVHIVGAGIGGLTCAIALRRSGYDVRTTERALQFAPVGAGIVLAPNAIYLLARLGVDVQSVGFPIKSLSLRDTHGRIIQRSDLTRISSGFGGALAFDRAELHKALADAVPSSLIRLGQAYSPSDSVAADEMLVGADGIYSAVRQNALGNVALRYSGYTCWRGICANPGITEAIEDWGGATRIGVVPLTRDRIYVFLVKTASAGLPRQTELAEIRHDFTRFADPIPDVLNALVNTKLLHHDLEELAKPVWGNGRTMLIGDAAHAMTPNLGQGAGMAIEDAVLLPKAIAEPNPADALRKLRHARVSEIHRSSRLLGKLAHWESPLACLLRDSLLRSIPQRISDRSYAQMIEAGMKLTHNS